MFMFRSHENLLICYRDPAGISKRASIGNLPKVVKPKTQPLINNSKSRSENSIAMSCENIQVFTVESIESTLTEFKLTLVELYSIMNLNELKTAYTWLLTVLLYQEFKTEYRSRLF